MAYNLKKELEKPETSGRGAQTLCRMRRRDRCDAASCSALDAGRQGGQLPMPPAVWKYPRLFIRIPHITTATSTRHSPMRAATLLRRGSCL